VLDDQVTSWTYDRLNRLVDQRASGLLRVVGSVNEPATVKVQGQPAADEASGFFVGGVSVGSGTTAFATQPGRSGTDAPQSLCGSRLMRTRCCIRFMVSVFSSPPAVSEHVRARDSQLTADS
jgi:hypothetical protein